MQYQGGYSLNKVHNHNLQGKCNNKVITGSYMMDLLVMTGLGRSASGVELFMSDRRTNTLECNAGSIHIILSWTKWKEHTEK